MTYDPFVRGPHPVGVRTVDLQHEMLGSRPVPLELWYPAVESHRGQDLDDSTWDHFTIIPSLPVASQQAVRDAAPRRGRYPLVMYFHGGYGQPRECTHLCTHLASHGYVVAAPRFPGDNITDVVAGTDGSEATIAKTPIDESAKNRPHQASLFIDLLLSLKWPAGVECDPERIGTTGISMGGFTSLALNSLDNRASAAFPMCPMFGERSLIPQVRRLQRLLRVDNWMRPVSTCVLTGALDPLVHVDDIRLLYGQMKAPKQLVVLGRAGHMHFADGAERGHEWYRQGYLSGAWPDPEIDGVALGTAMRPFAELVTEAQAGETVRALCLAHMDAHLKEERDEARAFLEGDLVGTFAARGVDLEVAVPASTGHVAAAL